MKLKDDFILHTMGDEVLLVSGDNSFSGIVRGNRTAALILNMMKEDITEEQIVDALAEQFDAPREVLTADVRALIRKLEDVGALTASAPISTFEEQIELRGEIAYAIKGDSMMPLLREGKDVAVISKKPEGRLSRFDVPLYKRDSGQYVLHRIVKVRDRDYLICGDNRYTIESGITDRHIIGVLTAFIRDGKTIPVTDPAYVRYVRDLYRGFAFKRQIRRVRAVVRRLFCRGKKQKKR